MYHLDIARENGVVLGEVVDLPNQHDLVIGSVKEDARIFEEMEMLFEIWQMFILLQYF